MQIRIWTHWKVTTIWLQIFFAENKNKILSDIDISKFPKSNKALYYCQEKIDTFQKSLETLKEGEHFYSTNTITRVIFEHFLVGHYIWLKTRNEKNDVCGEQYYNEYFVSECFKRLNYKIKIQGIKNNNKSKISLNLPTADSVYIPRN